MVGGCVCNHAFLAARDGVDRVPAFFFAGALTLDLAVVDAFLVGAAFLVVVAFFLVAAAVAAFLAVAAFFLAAAVVGFLVVAAAFFAGVAAFLALDAAEAFLVAGVVLVSFLVVVDDEVFSGLTSFTVPEVPKPS